MPSPSKIAALAATVSLVGFTPASAVIVEWAVADGGNGHFYERVDTPVAFEVARAAALAATHNGLNGYLVTVTSAAEDAFLINNVAGGIGWTSGSDAAVEGTWAWLDGPETGTVFWQNGVTLTYAQWGSGEPNSFRGEEDYLVIKFGQTAFWNDLPFNSGQGYYIEYSAAPTNGGIPEPSAWALMILGFGLAGGAVRARRQRLASAR